MDLNLLVHDGIRLDSREMIQRKLKECERLGYKSIALSVKVMGKEASKSGLLKGPTIDEDLHQLFPHMEIHTRLTVSLDDSTSLCQIQKSPHFPSYDLLAIEPLNDKVFLQFCGGNIDCDILTMSMGERMGFDMKRANFTTPLLRGICFEINYTDALFNQTSRINTISNGQLLVNKCKGKNMIISSGGRNVFSLRSPYDVSNLSPLFHLSESKGNQAVFTNGSLALIHGRGRKNPSSYGVVTSSLTGLDGWLGAQLDLPLHHHKEEKGIMSATAGTPRLEHETSERGADNQEVEPVTKKIKLTA